MMVILIFPSKAPPPEYLSPPHRNMRSAFSRMFTPVFACFPRSAPQRIPPSPRASLPPPTVLVCRARPPPATPPSFARYALATICGLVRGTPGIKILHFNPQSTLPTDAPLPHGRSDCGDKMIRHF